MADWNALLDHLANGPRENGTPELAAAAQWLAEELGRYGLTPERWEYVAHPWRLRIAGTVALLGGIAYVLAMLRQRHRVALAIAAAIPVLLIAELDQFVPLLGALHASPQQHVIATIPPTAGPATQRLVFSAHYDTKTDLLDHVERTPIQTAGLPLTLLMLFAAARPRPGLTKVAVVAGALNGLGLFLSLTGGAFVSARSHGAIDDGAGCAVVLELARTLRLEHTEVKVVFFSAEEIGLEGSQAWVKTLDTTLPTQVINLDGVGFSTELTLFKAEGGMLKSYSPDAKLVAAVDAVSPLYRAWYPGTTDARSFLKAGIPAMNLASELPGHALPRSLHSVADNRALVNFAALDEAVRVLTEVGRRLDRAAP
ncbi:MAG: M28 family peptidase [Myxococcaceae bacterium]|nr:M28 family peptidase [Myxococcaceae bacterium]